MRSISIFKYLIGKDKLNTYIVLGSNIAVFLMAFIFSIVMTNYCRVEDYGKYKYATNFILTLPALLGLGIDHSCGRLVASKKLDHNKTIISVSIIASAGISVIVTFLLYMAKYFLPSIGSFFSESIYVVLPFIIVFMLQSVINMIYQGTGEVVKIAVFNTLPYVIVILFSSIFILIKGELTFKYAIYTYLIANSIIIIPRIFFLQFQLVGIKESFDELIIEIKDSGFKVYLSSFFTRTASQLVGLVCGGYYGYTEYGYYALAISMAGAFRLISSSMAVAKYRQTVQSNEISKSDFLFLGLSNLGVFVMFLILIDTVFFWFFPIDYRQAITYLKILALANIIYGLSDYFIKFFIGKKLGQIVMINSSITGASVVLFSFILTPSFGIMGFVIATLISSAVDLAQSIIRYVIFQSSVVGEMYDASK